MRGEAERGKEWGGQKRGGGRLGEREPGGENSSICISSIGITITITSIHIHSIITTRRDKGRCSASSEDQGLQAEAGRAGAMGDIYIYIYMYICIHI